MATSNSPSINQIDRTIVTIFLAIYSITCILFCSFVDTESDFKHGWGSRLFHAFLSLVWPWTIAYIFLVITFGFWKRDDSGAFIWRRVSDD